MNIAAWVRSGCRLTPVRGSWRLVVDWPAFVKEETLRNNTKQFTTIHTRPKSFGRPEERHSAPRTSGSRLSALAVFPSPREATQEEFESFALPGVLCFRRSADVSLQDLGSGGISEPQRGHAVAVGFISPARCAVFSVLRRRLAPGARLGLYFRAPERPRSRRGNHWPCPVCCVFGASETSASRF